MAKACGIAIYLRVSREDGEQESQSILNQRAQIMRYAHNEGMHDVLEFCDDGFSGITFDRPGFNKMICAIERGEIATVITKDLSRLGRDYIMTGHYLERYFPAKNVRFIAINDGIDSDNGSDDLTPFRAVVNDMYARDISKKVRSALISKKREGLFIGAHAPYGYLRSEANKNVLEIDEPRAKVVRQIYKLAISGVSKHMIAQILSAKNIPAPSAVKCAERGAAAWNDVMIARILTNPTYCGCLTQNRARKISYKVEKRQIMERDEWITVENTHAPIVSIKIFKMAQKTPRKIV